MAQDEKIDEWPEAEWGKNAEHNYDGVVVNSEANKYDDVQL
jgi:hypothetical protein